MPLTLLPELTTEVPQDAALEALLSAAERRRDRFLDDPAGPMLPAFVPCDLRVVAPTLAAIAGCHLAPGPLFLEWGSGLGGVTAIAAQLGFRAHGIEIEASLVKEARSLVSAHGLRAEFACGSFVPEGDDDLIAPQEDLCWLREGGDCGYEILGREPDDFDVVFAYPWPGEEDVIDTLFARRAARGALLVTFHGREGMRVQRQAGAPDQDEDLDA